MDTLNRMPGEIARQLTVLQIACAHDGYFRSENKLAVAEEFRDSGANLLFVGRSSPKNEIFVGCWAKATRARVIDGVGGVVGHAGRRDQRAHLVEALGFRTALPSAVQATRARSEIVGIQVRPSLPWFSRNALPPDAEQRLAAAVRHPPARRAGRSCRIVGFDGAPSAGRRLIIGDS
jgi:hypothetical protein